MTRKPICRAFTVGAGTNAADAATEETAELRRQAEEGLRNRLKVHGSRTARRKRITASAAGVRARCHHHA